MDFNDLMVYQKSFQLAMEVFEMTISLPKEEKYALTSQILTMPATRGWKSPDGLAFSIMGDQRKKRKVTGGIKPGAI